MSRLERAILGLAIGIACPLLTFVVCWWTAAAFNLWVSPLPTGVIVAAALAGFGLGCLLDAVFLRRWANGFYASDPRLMAVLYLGLSVIAVGLCMGIPAGTFALGIAAGVYRGRREYHRGADAVAAASACRRTAIVAAFVTAGAALPIGLLALQSETQILRSLEAALGLGSNRLGGIGGLSLVGVLCLLLAGMQYGGTRTAGCLAFRMGASDPCQGISNHG